MVATTTDDYYARKLVAQQRYAARTPEYRLRQNEVKRAHRQRYPEAYKARTAVGNALRGGRLVRPTCCDRCGSEGKVQAHHHDYSEPLVVEWVCSGCHGKEHRGNIND